MRDSHTIQDGRVHIYRRVGSRFWQCATYLGGQSHGQTTKQDNIAYAIEFARDGFLDRVAEDRLRRRGIEPPPMAVVPKPLAVEPQQVVPIQAESADGRL